MKYSEAKDLMNQVLHEWFSDLDDYEGKDPQRYWIETINRADVPRLVEALANAWLLHSPVEPDD